MENSITNIPIYPIPRTRSVHIYDVLKEAIINGQLKANQRINEKKLAEQFQVSRTPVREAVVRLIAEGFVTTDSYRRPIVREISFNELRDIFQILGALDSTAITLAVDNLTLKDIKRLEILVEKMEKNCRPDAIETYLELNIKFHNAIWEAVPNKLFREMLFLVRDKLLRYNDAQVYAFKKRGALERSLKQHKELIEAITAKDKERLRTLIEKHRNSLWENSDYSKSIKEYLDRI